MPPPPPLSITHKLYKQTLAISHSVVTHTYYQNDIIQKANSLHNFLWHSGPCQGSGSYILASTEFDPWPVHMGSVVDKVPMGQISLLSISVFSHQYHSTNTSHSGLIHLP